MHSIRFISAVLKENWFIDPVFSLSHGPVIASILNIQTNFATEEPDALSAFAINAKEQNGEKYSFRDGYNMAAPGSVAVISLKGPLMKQDMHCGPAGTATIGQFIKDADAHQNISSIVLHIDSPGGTVDGTEALANIIRTTSKPVVAFVDGMMASAALWIGSAANEIIASTDTDIIGSVGVVMNFSDMQPYWESKGVVFHSIVASTSQEKTKLFDEIRAGNYENYIKSVLNPLDEKFMNTIKSAFPNCQEQHLTGKSFFARDVIGVFVNSIGTLNTAIQRAYELSSSQQSNSNNLKNTGLMKQFANLNTVLGIESLESVDESVSLNEAQLEAIDSALVLNDQAIADARTEAETQRDAAAASQLTAETNLANAFTDFDAIDATVAAATTPATKAEAIVALLASRPGIAPVAIVKKDEAPETVEVDWEAINNLPHNIAVDKNS